MAQTNGKNRPRPMYRFIARELMADITQGVYAHGSNFPSEANLQSAYDVSRVTVRSALKLLEEQGFIKRQQGSGTIVLGRAIIKSNTLTNFNQEALGHLKNPKSKILHFKKRPSLPRERLILNLTDQEDLIELKRLRFLDNYPVVLQTTFLPLDLMEGATSEELEDCSLYEYLKIKKNIHLAYADQVVEPFNIGSCDAAYLKVEENAAVMRSHRTAYSESGRAVEYSINIIRGDYYKYSFRLKPEELQS